MLLVYSDLSDFRYHNDVISSIFPSFSFFCVEIFHENLLVALDTLVEVVLTVCAELVRVAFVKPLLVVLVKVDTVVEAVYSGISFPELVKAEFNLF